MKICAKESIAGRIESFSKIKFKSVLHEPNWAKFHYLCTTIEANLLKFIVFSLKIGDETGIDGKEWTVRKHVGAWLKSS